MRLVSALAALALTVSFAPVRAQDVAHIDVDVLVERMTDSWRWRTLPEPPLAAPRRLAVDANGALMALGDGAAAVFDGYTWSRRPLPAELLEKPELTPDVLVVDHAAGQLQLPQGLLAPIVSVRGDEVEPISTTLRFVRVIELRDGLWIGLRDDGLYTAIDAERAPSFEGITGRSPVFDMCWLPSGRLVVLRPTRDVLVCDLLSERWRTHDPTSVGLSPLVTAIAPSTRGGTWLGTNDGVAHMRADGDFDESFAALTLADGTAFELRTVTALHEQADGTLWLGSGATFYGAVERRGDGVVLHDDPAGLGPHRVHQIRELADDELWFCLLNARGQRAFGQGGGLARRRADGTWRRWTSDGDLPHGRVYDVVRHDGEVYAGTRAGVVVHDPRRDAWRPVALPEAVAGAHTREFVSRDDGLWIAMQGETGGVVRVEFGDDPTRVVASQVWRVPSAESMEFDGAGTPWVTSRRGLWRLRDGLVHPTSQADGLSPSLWPVMWDGERLFAGGSRRGLLSFREDDVDAPRVLGATDRWDTEQDELRIVVEVRDAWNRTPPSSMRVSWRRPGGEWSEPRSVQDEIVLGAAPVGRSAIEIRAFDASGHASTEDFALTIVRPAPWSRRTSTWVLVVAVAAAAASYVHERRAHRNERKAARRALLEVQENERRAISRDIHDDLGQLLNAAMIELSRTRRLDAPRRAEALTHARAACRSAIERSDSLSLLLRPRSLDELGLRRALQHELEDFARRSNLAVASRLDELPEHVPDDVAVQVYRIAVEALTNISRHADGARRVDVAVRTTPRRFELTIRDDGRGFDESVLARSERLGVLGMRERAQILGGRFELETSPATGTCVKLIVPRTRILG